MTTIQITRNKGWYGRIRTVKIMADGQKIGTLSAGETSSFSVPLGTKEVYGKMDWGRTCNVIPAADIVEGAKFQINFWFTLNPFKLFAVPHIPARFKPL